MPATSVDLPFFFGTSMYAMRYRRVPSERFQPKRSRTTSLCQRSRTKGCPAHSPLTWTSMSSKNPQARSAASLSNQKPFLREVAPRLFALACVIALYLDPRTCARRHAELLLVGLENG